MLVKVKKLNLKNIVVNIKDVMRYIKSNLDLYTIKCLSIKTRQLILVKIEFLEQKLEIQQDKEEDQLDFDYEIYL